MQPAKYTGPPTGKPQLTGPVGVRAIKPPPAPPPTQDHAAIDALEATAAGVTRYYAIAAGIIISVLFISAFIKWVS